MRATFIFFLAVGFAVLSGCETAKVSVPEAPVEKEINIQASGAVVDIEAGDEVAVGKNGVKLEKGLLLGDVVRSGRSQIHTDPLEALIIDGAFAAPQAGEPLVFGDTNAVWNKISVNTEGWFTGEGVRAGYIYVPVVSDEEIVKLMHIKGASFAYVNDAIRMGNPYTYKDKRESWEPNYDFVVLPVKLRKGTNHILLNGGRGQVKVQLFDPKADAQFNLADKTTPDLHYDQALDSQAGIIVINNTDAPMIDLTVQAIWPDGHTDVSELPIIAPMTSRKVPVQLTSKATRKESVTVVLNLIRSSKILDRAAVELSVKQPGENYKETFVSAIDSSVQYYAVNPAVPGTGSDALILSVHGASVEATGQAGSYSHKRGANLAAATNRRPYGFDWEDWGRIDALEVLEIVRAKFNPDPSRIYLTGHSMGGHGTWILGAQFPDKFAALGPSAGWANFWTYRGFETPKEMTATQAMLSRADSTSHAELWFSNLANKGVYCIHGDADDNVPIEQSYFMVDHLKKYNTDHVFHIEKGMGHWWDISAEPGADCVDWAPMFDFMNRRRLPESESVKTVSFTTSNPGVSAWRNWAGIIQQIEPLKFSKIDITAEPGQNRFVGKTKNVELLSLKLTGLGFGESVSVILDEQEVTGIKIPASRQVYLLREGGAWKVADKPSLNDKGPHRNGPFKEGFNHNMAFVYGTAGTPEENAAIYNKARYDAEKFWYRGNGSVDVVADTEFDLSDKERGIVLYGNSSNNTLWNTLLADSPVQVSGASVQIGNRQIEGDDLACIFVRPRKGSDKACVAVVAGTGVKGLKLTQRLSYLYAGSNYPDAMVISSEMLSDGPAGVLAAGFFGNDWSVSNGSFAYRTDEASQE